MYPHLVQVAWHTVEKLVKDWSKNPHYWEREIDIQAELRGRLATLYGILGMDEVIGTEQDPSATDKTLTYRYSRVACEPSIPYKYLDGKRYRAVPDMVVWDDLKDPGVTPEFWPILWACEIKYMTGTVADWDIEKLGYLVDQGCIKFGCWLTFQRDKNIKVPTCSWEKSTHGARLWTCIAKAPSLAGLT